MGGTRPCNSQMSLLPSLGPQQAEKCLELVLAPRPCCGVKGFWAESPSGLFQPCVQRETEAQSCRILVRGQAHPIQEGLGVMGDLDLVSSGGRAGWDRCGCPQGNQPARDCHRATIPAKLQTQDGYTRLSLGLSPFSTATETLSNCTCHKLIQGTPRACDLSIRAVQPLLWLSSLQAGGEYLAGRRLSATRQSQVNPP